MSLRMTHKERNRSLIRTKDTAQQQVYLPALQATVSDIYSYGIIESRVTRILLLGTLRSDDGDGNGNAAKTIGLISKTTILHVHHAFLYISLPSLHDYDVKMPNYTMYSGRTQATTKFPLSF